MHFDAALSVGQLPDLMGVAALSPRSLPGVGRRKPGCRDGDGIAGDIDANPASAQRLRDGAGRSAAAEEVRHYVADV